MHSLRNLLKGLGLSLLTAFILQSCASTKEAGGGKKNARQPEVSNIAKTDLVEGGLNLDEYRNKLSDVYTSEQQDMPEVFQRHKSETREDRDIYDGYRIQILSTRNVARADTISRHFTTWIDTLGVTYQPDTYIIFKQPYYRVHVGDFHNSDQAYDFSRIVKRKYPDAWVVHDRIHPGKAPADTLKMEIKPKKAAADSTGSKREF